MTALVDRDARVAWHPYTQHGVDREPLPVIEAAGAWLRLADGRRLLDAISSWWATLHGHGQPELVVAMAEQARTLDHVLFAGATHEPAIALAEDLLAIAPHGLARVFYSDNGSTAVEIALKMAYHAHALRGDSARTVFLALEGGYHGDTFGAMAVSDPAPFFEPYKDLLFEVVRVAPAAKAVAEAIGRAGEALCAVILEPMVQGAAGMVMYSDEVLVAARQGCDDVGGFLVVDEVMTGFGRTGRMFGCDHAGVAPDLMCVAKGLTGGILPMAATLATEAIFDSFLHADRSRFFPHGHTFTAHPIGCAVARASIKLCLENDVPRRLAHIGARVLSGIQGLATEPWVREIRQLGGIVAIDLVPASGSTGYLSNLAPRIRRRAVEEGVLLRPLGNVLYAMPPACTTDSECEIIARAMVRTVTDVMTST